MDFNAYPNKDAFLFPELVRSPKGELALCLMHRPMYERWSVEHGALPEVTLYGAIAKAGLPRNFHPVAQAA